MNQPHWVQRDVVLALHERLLAEFGGTPGLRDENLFDSALGRPQNLLSYGAPTITDLAGAYAFGLVRNHAFLDGNKRIGFAVAVLFLELNGYRFQASEADAAIQTLAMAAGDLDESQYAAWLKDNSFKKKR